MSRLPAAARSRSFRIRTFAPYLVLAVGLAGLCFYAYPGFMSYDSFIQLRQARSGVFGDAHPPAVAALWRLVEHVVEGPFGMLVLQTSAFLAGAYLILRRWMSAIPAAVLAVCLLWFPPIGTMMAVIWKDSQMLGYLLLGLGLLLGSSRRSQAAGLLVLVLASAMRHNAFTITLALVIYLFRWSEHHGRLERYALSVAAWLAITVAASAVNTRLTDVHEHGWQLIAIQDIGGMIRFAPPLDDAELHQLLDGSPLLPKVELQAQITRAYSPRAGALTMFSERIFAPPPTTAEQRDVLAAAWWTLLRSYPEAYLRERWHTFREVLALPKHRYGSVWVGITRDGADLVASEPSEAQQTLEAAALWIGSSWLMRPCLYLYLLLALLPFAVRARDRVCLTLMASALLSEAALFFLSPAADFRYSIWLCVVSLLSAIRLVTLRARAEAPTKV